MKRKDLVVGIVLVIILASIIPALAQNAEKSSQPTSSDDLLYVGGSGPGNYSKIQDAINDSLPGDTIYVFSGTYHEAITVNVGALNIIGEGRDGTIITENWTDAAVVIEKNYVSFRGFTITGNTNGIYVQGGLTALTISENNLTKNRCGIEYEHDWDNNDNVVENNIFYSNDIGIYLVSWYELKFNTIRNNTFIKNVDGLLIVGKNNRILNNTFFNNHGDGMYLSGESSTVQGNIFIENIRGMEVDDSGHTITGNIFIENNVGLYVTGSEHQITGNLFENNSLGIQVSGSKTKVNQNNFIQNEKHAQFAEKNRSHENTWDNNYWSDSFPRLGCTFIFGTVQTGIKKLLQFNPYDTSYYWIPWINLDRDPAQEPYGIRGG